MPCAASTWRFRRASSPCWSGQSGCGKSTLLRTIAGLEDADEGTIEIGGEVVNDVLPRDRDIAMVFQNYALYPYMTVYDNIAFGLRARKTPRAEIDPKVRRAAQMLGIEHCSTAIRGSSQAASCSGSRSAAPSCATRGCTSSTNRCPTSTRNCATRCAARSSGCTRSWARP